jgi:hypothetical protein
LLLGSTVEVICRPGLTASSTAPETEAVAAAYPAMRIDGIEMDIAPRTVTLLAPSATNEPAIAIRAKVLVTARHQCSRYQTWQSSATRLELTTRTSSNTFPNQRSSGTLGWNIKSQIFDTSQAPQMHVVETLLFRYIQVLMKRRFGFERELDQKNFTGIATS